MSIAASPNGTVFLRTVTPTMISVPAQTEFYEAVPNTGYYFKRWAFLDRSKREINCKTLSSEFLVENFISKSLMDIIAQDERNRAFYIQAIFTNNPDVLVPVIGPDIEVATKNKQGDLIPFVNYTLSSLPERKVEGTRLWQFLTIDDKNFQIQEVLLGVGSTDGIVDVIVQSPISLVSRTALTFLDHVFIDSFDNRIEWKVIVLEEINS